MNEFDIKMVKKYGSSVGVDVTSRSRHHHLAPENFHAIENRNRRGGELVVLQLHEAELRLLSCFVYNKYHNYLKLKFKIRMM